MFKSIENGPDKKTILALAMVALSPGIVALALHFIGVGKPWVPLDVGGVWSSIDGQSPDAAEITIEHPRFTIELDAYSNWPADPRVDRVIVTANYPGNRNLPNWVVLCDSRGRNMLVDGSRYTCVVDANGQDEAGHAVNLQPGDKVELSFDVFKGTVKREAPSGIIDGSYLGSR